MIPKTLQRLAVPVDTLKTHPRNPRRGDLEAIRKSLEIHGQFRPVVANKRTQEVLAGNHTLLAARELGWEKLAVTWVDVDEDEAVRIMLADNRVAELAGWDEALLAELLGELPDFEGTGWDEDALRELLRQAAPKQGLTSPDAVPEPPKKPKSKLGDLWALGPHRLLCGDATSAEDLERLVGSDSAVLIWTDPPYGVSYRGGTKRQRELAGDQTASLYEPALRLLRGLLPSKAALYLAFASANAGTVYTALGNADFDPRALLIWVKNQAQFGAMGAHYKQQHEPVIYAAPRGGSAPWYGPNNETTVWEIPRLRANDLHPTQKPVDLVSRALRNSSRPKDVVVDPFVGSGTTIIAAETEGRVCYAMDIDPVYCDVAVKRWEDFTGQKAVKV